MRFTLMAVIWGGGKKRALAEKISHVAAVILGKMSREAPCQSFCTAT